MKKILFTKFSRERREEFQIMTRICEADGIRIVEKSALSPKSFHHVNRMETIGQELEACYQLSGLLVCPCKKTAEGTVVFPFLRARSMEEAISQAGSFAELKGFYELLYKILRTQNGISEFQNCDSFCEVFGDVRLPEKLLSVPVSNIDMIPGNLLQDEHGIWNLVDYEWVYPFPIPIEFIFARSVFLNERACSLSIEEQSQLYAIAGITMDQVPTYFSMEVSFQESIVGKREEYALSKVYSALHRKVYAFPQMKTDAVCFNLILAQTTPSPLEMDFVSTVETDASISLKLRDADPKGQMKLSLTGQEGVIKILKLIGSKNGREEEISFTSNAAIVIYDDYYFDTEPELFFENQEYDYVVIRFRVYWSGHGVARELIRLINSEKTYRELADAKEARARDLEGQIRRLESEKQALEAELLAMRQRKVVKMADKVQQVLKKEKK